MSGKPTYAWEPDKRAYVGVMKRRGSAKDIVWFRAKLLRLPCDEAWEDGDRIVADVMEIEEAPLYAAQRLADRSGEIRARQCRWSFDLLGVPTDSSKPISTI